MRFAYADPPYLGQGVKHYGALHDDAADCDTEAWHKALIDRLCDEFPDGWALSLHTPRRLAGRGKHGARPRPATCRWGCLEKQHE